MSKTNPNIVRHLVEDVERVEYLCDCKQGYYHYATNEKRIEQHNQMPHRCTHCKKLVYFTVPYPHLRYKGKDFAS